MGRRQHGQAVNITVGFERVPEERVTVKYLVSSSFRRLEKAAALKASCQTQSFESFVFMAAFYVSLHASLV